MPLHHARIAAALADAHDIHGRRRPSAGSTVTTCWPTVQLAYGTTQLANEPLRFAFRPWEQLNPAPLTPLGPLAVELGVT